MKIRVVVFMTLIFWLLMITPYHVLANHSSLNPQWSRTYNNYSAVSVVQVSDAGFMIVGANNTYHYASAYHGYNSDPLFMKLNNRGMEKWAQFYQKGNGTLDRLIQVSDSEYVLGLNVHGTYYTVLKVDSKGNTQWSRTISMQHGQRVSGFTVTEDGGYVIASYNLKPDSYSNYFMVIDKYDANWNLLWQKTFGEDSAVNVKAWFFSLNNVGGGDGYYLAGYWGADFWFAKLDLFGEIVWSRVYCAVSSNGQFAVVSVIPIADDGFLFRSADYSSSCLVKLDGDGDVLWMQYYDYLICDVVELNSGGMYWLFNGSGIVCLGGFDGGELWFESYAKFVKNFGGYVLEEASVGGVSGVVCDDGGVVVAVTFHITGNPPVGIRGPCYLWVAKFSTDSSSSFVGGGLLWVVFGVVVVVVFVGVLFYLKKKRW